MNDLAILPWEFLPCVHQNFYSFYFYVLIDHLDTLQMDYVINGSSLSTNEMRIPKKNRSETKIRNTYWSNLYTTKVYSHDKWYSSKIQTVLLTPENDIFTNNCRSNNDRIPLHCWMYDRESIVDQLTYRYSLMSDATAAGTTTWLAALSRALLPSLGTPSFLTGSK